MKMSEEEQIERMKRNQERLNNKKKPPIPALGAQTQGSQMKEEVCQIIYELDWLNHIYDLLHVYVY